MDLDLSNPIVQAIIVVVVTIVAMILTTMLSGYDSLCAIYPVRDPYTGPWVDFQTMKFGAMWHLQRCMSVAFSPDSLYVKWGFLNPFARKMQIPWTDIEAIREQQIALYSNVEFLLKNRDPVTFLYTSELRSYVETKIPELGLTRLTGGTKTDYESYESN